MKPLTKDRLLDVLNYDPPTGSFFWRANNHRVRAGDVAGHINERGYVVLRIDQCNYMAHSAAWLIKTGSMPHRRIIHKNGNKRDNRLANLAFAPKAKSFPSELTATRVRQLLRYNAETGELRWARSRGCRSTGSVATCDARWNGRPCTRVDGKLYPAHRIIWLHVHGEWPPTIVDHINGNPSDNRLANLRLATAAQNVWNSKTASRNTSGVRGVSRTKYGIYVAFIDANGTHHHLGYFATLEQASRVRAAAEVRLFGEFRRA